ncbi:DUF3035 domain-containing protein [uncultured Sphingorhabdus sp.]|jgi:hypothetical protein|uniref:DUF3035 domain-containing protein n=1 Tax=uncultured Sphingorhabdus sp. TaxID=1686106 RepID=UPI002614B605|nr:DUF3035 domain-containing protein [uncultured Sphingorhabdus sp.]HMS20189.1 DUF3035 domain-containing protein [Sphingorhabdus sp.]
MTRKFIIASASLLALTALSGCGTSSVLDRERPDEFAVGRAAPIVVPADLNTLPTPQPGAARPQEGETKAAMLEAMFGAPKQ